MSALGIETAGLGEQGDPARPRPRRPGLALAGFALPVVLAVLWEVAVRSGFANGR